MRVLLLEDDVLIADGIVRGLEKFGMTVDCFSSGRSGMQALTAAPYDVVILDLGLPEMDGMDVLAHWREQQEHTPVLILTARDALENRLAGLNAGADDYLLKPFELSELVARLQALVRRSQGFSSSHLDYGQLRLDTAARTAFLNDQALNLSIREYSLLELFVTHPGQVLSRAMIEDKLYGWEQEVESNAVEVHIHHLRKKIGSRFIKTRRGLGYMLGDKP